MKLEIKNIIILVLLGFVLFFGYSWLFSDNSGYKEKVKQLEKEYGELENEKKMTDKEIKKLKLKYDSLDVLDKTIKKDLVRLENELKNAESKAKISKSQLLKLQSEISENRKKIADFKKNPPTKTDEALLESIKNKTQK